MPNKIENKQTGIQEKREDRVTLAVCFRKRTQTQTWMRRQIVVGWAVILLPLFHPVINLFTNQIYLAGNQPHNHFYRQRQQIFSPLLRAYVIERRIMLMTWLHHGRHWFGFPHDPHQFGSPADRCPYDSPLREYGDTIAKVEIRLLPVLPSIHIAASTERDESGDDGRPPPPPTSPSPRSTSSRSTCR
jgi:hypothetical protein